MQLTSCGPALRYQCKLSLAPGDPSAAMVPPFHKEPDPSCPRSGLGVGRRTLSLLLYDDLPCHAVEKPSVAVYASVGAQGEMLSACT
jgi:hypothetical protein